ncbi:MAG: ATP-binding cassette domain-containing protein [Pseudomonadota bacterium]|uniref:ABC transporter ATP-binding protein n=1 Tax=Burkholderia sp. 4M9327F10 TaxID=2502223 RepID=UPI0010F64052|nr:ATP-binding cassette domain-containing protein [Burkholderia sp. 4M9327F10]
MFALELTNIHKRYGDHEVLKGVSLRAVRGDVISIIGSSGSGKSTLLRCINLLEQPNEGTIAVGGEPIRLKETRHGLAAADRRQLERMRTRLAMVFQHFNLWAHLTVLENIMMAPMRVQKRSREAARECAFEVLRKVKLDPVKVGNAYPAHLSGGQQQRVAIARALAVDPEVLLFDEPTSALDPELVGEVLTVMKELAREGRTMVVVTHEMTFAREVSSEVVFLHQGKVDERGKPGDVFGNCRSERLRQFLSGALK